MPNPWTGTGNPYSRTAVLEPLHATLGQGKPIIAAGAGIGISVISALGGPFPDQHADEALCGAPEAGLRPDIPRQSLDCDINDPAFAQACVEPPREHPPRGVTMPEV